MYVRACAFRLRGSDRLYSTKILSGKLSISIRLGLFIYYSMVYTVYYYI